MTSIEILDKIKKLEEQKKNIDLQVIELRNEYYKIHREEEKRKKEKEDNAPPPDLSFLEDGDWGI
jgi:hypothetical protein